MRRRVGVLTAVAVLAMAGCTSPGSTGTTPTPRTSTSTSPPVSAPVSTPVSTPVRPSSSATSSTPRSVTILGSGDVLIHPPLWRQAHRDAVAAGHDGYDFGPMYASVAPTVGSADLAVCELETPLAPPQGPFVGYPDFSAPPQVLTALHGVGYRACSTASNHTLDQGPAGIARTLGELDDAGFRHTGSARSAAEAARPVIVTTAGGVRVGLLAYAFGFNGIALPTPWAANTIDVPRILAAARAEKRAGADVVVVSMHWGVEYDHLATDEQRSQARQLLRSPYVDLILGAHAHVVQPAERIAGKWVFYGMGNQISRHADPIAVGRQGVMPRVTFTRTPSGRFVTSAAEAIPTWMADTPALRLIDLPRALASSDLTAAQRREDVAAHRAVSRYLNAYGAAGSGLSVR